jgi:hypothetical protein
LEGLAECVFDPVLDSVENRENDGRTDFVEDEVKGRAIDLFSYSFMNIEVKIVMVTSYFFKYVGHGSYSARGFVGFGL